MDCETSHKFVKKRSHRKHKTSKGRRRNDSSGDEFVDVSEKIFPIAHYTNDREEMINQVFSVMEKEKLNCMLPPILKGMTMSVLKENCLNELRKMSDEEVRKVLCGEPLGASIGNKLTPKPAGSGSGGSQSLVEGQNSEEHEKRTLLDILELEMQEIAYNTVMKRDDNAHCMESDLPEIVAIIPTHSPKMKIDVPLICLDSEDEEVNSSSQPDQQQINTSTGHTTTNDACTKSHQNSSSCLEGESIASYSSNKAAEDANKKPNTLSNISQKCSNSQESILIQIFSNKTPAVERIVKKVNKTSVSLEEVDKVSVSSKEQKSDKLEENANNSTQQQVEEDEEIIILENENKVDKSIDAPTPENLLSQTDSVDKVTINSPSISQLLETCIDLEDPHSSIDSKNGEICSEKLLEPLQDEEKEEGEITDAESEKDIAVLETVRDRHRSPTVVLSSGGSDNTNNVEKTESRNKVRKHHHRHRKSKRNTESPERSRRQIEKRGNRSYRRKTSSSLQESVNPVEKEATEENTGGTSPKNVLPEVTTDIITPSEADSEAPAAEHDPLLEKPPQKIATESAQDGSSPKDSEILPESNLESPEETEESDSSEPLSSKTSWADRWAEKKDLRKVVITSKICRNVRKRILSARKKKLSIESSSVETPELPPVPPLVLHVEGSVQEYQMLQLLVDDVSNEEDSQNKSVTTDESEDTKVSDSMAGCESVCQTVQALDSSSTLSQSELEEKESLNEMECN